MAAQQPAGDEKPRDEEETLVFKNRTRTKNLREKKRDREDGQDEDDNGEADDDASAQIQKKARIQFQKRGLTSTSTRTQKEEDEHFATSGSAMPIVSGKDFAAFELEKEEEEKPEGGIITDSETGKKIYLGKMREIGLVHQKHAGPMKSTANLRVTVRFDYAPDICKDYKETGDCGYGDSCKFMHDRGDYKNGWQIERDWEAQQKKIREAKEKGIKLDEKAENPFFIGDDDKGDNLPFVCQICRGPFKNPVVTKCKHYFCEDCAVEHHQKEKTCAVCKQPTLGIFNVAHEINRKMAANGGRMPLPTFEIKSDEQSD